MIIYVVCKQEMDEMGNYFDDYLDVFTDVDRAKEYAIELEGEYNTPVIHTVEIEGRGDDSK